MRRREFLAAGLSAIAAPALAATAHAAAKVPPGETWPVGDFVVGRTDRGLQVAHAATGRVIFETAPDGAFLAAETAVAAIRSFGVPEGAFDIEDDVTQSWNVPTIDVVTADAAGVKVSGGFAGGMGTIGYEIAFTALSATHLQFAIRPTGPDAGKVNRIRLSVASPSDEGVFGFGQQMTFFNQKGHLLPILVQEHGVGRGQAVVTEIIDLMANHGGGTPYTTECPAPHFITSRLRSLFLENLEYSLFDLRQSDTIDIKVWSSVMTGRILLGDTPLDLISAYSDYCGRMRALPDWINAGIVVSVQGGTDAVRAKLDAINKAEIPLAGLWIQDWPGVRVTDVGKQLWWNWKLDEAYYPGWSELVADLAAQGARMLTYINPFLSHEEGHDSLYKEALANGGACRP
jgi:alpha-glucosidase